MKHTVFLSATSDDLHDHREAVLEAIDRMEDFDWIAMEKFGALAGDPVQGCVDRVKKAHVFVGLVGHFFGTKVPGDGRSFTQLEYDEARKAGIPCLMFLANANFPITSELWAKNDQDGQDKFRKEISLKDIRDTFLHADELATRVVTALHNWKNQRHQGMRALRAVSPSLSFGGGFPLQSHFTGRAPQRRLLTSWFEQGPAVHVLGGFGGMGKSSLAWVWLCQDVHGLPILGQDHGADPDNPSALPPHHRPDGSMWWSFYERPQFADFLREALRYFDSGSGDLDGGNEPGLMLSQADAMRLAEQLAERRALVVLDGFERLLESFVPDEATRTGTDGRTCVDPLARAFLQALIRYPVKSRILLASRIPPQEIEKASCCSGTTLGGLDPIDAIRFLGSQGVKGSDDELRRAGEQWDFHPLSLRLLAGALVNDAELKGEIRHAPWISVAQMSAGNQEDPDTQKLTHLLRFAYDRLRNPSAKEDDSLRELMRRIAAFQSAITFERLAGSMVPTDRDMLKAHLTALRNRGLLSFNSEKCTFEMHPSVRRYFNDQLRTRTSTHEEIWGHLVAVRARLRSGMDNRDEFSAALEQFHQALKHERFDRAVNVFEQSLFVPLFFREGAFRQCQELLQRLEPAQGPGQRTSRRATYYQDRDQAWVLNALGLVCARTGEPQRSQELLLRALEHYTSTEDRRAMRVTLGNLVRTQLLLGRLDVAERTLQHRSDLTADQRRSTAAGRWRLRLANRANAVVNAVGRLLSPDDYRRALRPPSQAPAMAGGDNRSGEVTPHIGDRIAGLDPLDRGELHTLRGEPELALLALDRAATILWRRPDALSTVELYRARAWLAADNPQTALESTRKASELWQEATAQSLHHAGNAMSIDLVLGTSHLMLAERKQLPVDISEAERYLVKALNSIRISGYIELLPDALSSWARFCLARGDASGAVEHAAQAMNVSRPYPLKYAAASDLLDRIQREVRVRANGSSALTREASP